MGVYVCVHMYVYVHMCMSLVYMSVCLFCISMYLCVYRCLSVCVCRLHTPRTPSAQAGLAVTPLSRPHPPVLCRYVRWPTMLCTLHLRGDIPRGSTCSKRSASLLVNVSSYLLNRSLSERSSASAPPEIRPFLVLLSTSHHGEAFQSLSPVPSASYVSLMPDL